MYILARLRLTRTDFVTNWYIRFNRGRLKGENGIEDTLKALNTLFDVIFTLVRGLAPFTPFITDNLYLRLLPYIPKELQAEDPRSVHFLAFPEVRAELFDEVIERRVGRMQRVIELGRVSRERRTIGLKTPLKSLVLIHPDAEYLEDVRGLGSEICRELNVRDLITSSDEAKYNVQYSADVDFPTLGKKFKKDAQKVKKALPNLSSSQVKGFLETGKMTVENCELSREDLIIKRGIKKDDSSKDLEMNTDDDVLIILDVKKYPELEREGLAREILNRVNKLRKKAGLVPTDDVKMEYKMLKDPDNVGLEQVFEDQADMIQKALRRPIDKHISTEVAGEVPNGMVDVVITEEEQEIQNATFLLRLVKL